MKPNNPQTDDTGDLYDQFLATLDEVTVCCYCSNPVDKDGQLCCDEVHAEEVYDNGEEYLRLDDGSLEKAFQAWLTERGPDPMQLAKDYDESQGDS